ncbi:protein FAM13A [Platysternon megacephalum]|uniref:Protein FAM13A n=1 Tax=Platysternon megacephalum TaxID=55544 RepID=A0A4D9DP75_9SAUR|nr:protein FAM13A [Platysternon megacephalum]
MDVPPPGDATSSSARNGALCSTPSAAPHFHACCGFSPMQPGAPAPQDEDSALPGGHGRLNPHCPRLSASLSRDVHSPRALPQLMNWAIGHGTVPGGGPQHRIHPR